MFLAPWIGDYRLRPSSPCIDAGDNSVVQPGWTDLGDLNAQDLRPDDRWILARMNATVDDVTGALARFRFHELARLLYEFMWNEFCDWYVESVKAVLNNGEAKAQEVGLRVFDCVTQTFLRLLHPVMPFVTEELYHQLNFSPADGSIMESPWPTSMTDAELERLGATQNLVDLVAAKFELIRAVRNVRAGYLIPAVKKTDVIIDVTSGDTCEFMQQDLVSLKALLYASDVKVVTAFQAEGPTAVAVSTIGTAYVPLAGIIDVTAEKTRLQKQEDELLGFLAKSQRKLGNEQFVSRAPAEVVSRERERLTELRDKLERLREQLAALA